MMKKKEQNNTEDKQIIDTLNEIKKMLTVIAKAKLDSVFKQEIKNEGDLKLYRLTGKYNQKELSKKLNIASGTISNRWRKWESLGLLIKDGKTYRKVL